MKYNYKNYLKYRKTIDRKIGKPLPYKKWLILQPIADSVIGKVNRIINSK